MPIPADEFAGAVPGVARWLIIARRNRLRVPSVLDLSSGIDRLSPGREGEGFTWFASSRDVILMPEWAGDGAGKGHLGNVNQAWLADPFSAVCAWLAQVRA